MHSKKNFCICRPFLWLLLAALAVGMLAAPSVQAEELVYLEETVIGHYTQTGGISEKEALNGYARKVMYFEQDASGGKKRSTLLRDRLETDKDKAVYDYLKNKITKVAAGELTSTEFTLPLSEISDKTAYTASELGVSAVVVDGGFSQTALDNFYALVWPDTGSVISALLGDCPYELYWYDKTKGTRSSIGGIYGDSTTLYADECYLIYRMCVSRNYTSSSTVPSYTVDTDKTNSPAVQAAAAKVQQILSDNSGKSDYNKLKAYKNAICSLNEYNHEAADDNTTPYGNPWQLVSVFDGDPTTNVVCEGYSKAFQYLCELTSFSGSVYVISPTGTMGGGTGSGPHMWNIVTIGGKSYLVDVTNCDSGWPLFMRGYTSIQEQGESIFYLYDCSGSTIWYVFDDNSLGQYTAEIGNLEGTEYTPPEHVHSMTMHPARAADCMDPGNTLYWSCDGCGEYFSDANGEHEIEVNSWVIPKTPHHMTAHAAVPATCTTDGNIAYWSCDVCINYFSDEAGEHEIPENGWVIDAHHTLTKHPEKAATCTEGGNEEYWLCSACGKYFTDESGLISLEAEFFFSDPLGHNWGAPVYTHADDYSTVTAVRTCARCSAQETETAALTGVVTQTAGCTAAELTDYMMLEDFENQSFLPQEYVVETAPALGHAWGAPVYTPAGDYSTVTAVRNCGRCSAQEMETAALTGRKTRDAGCEVTEQTTYTSADFENSAFSVQTFVADTAAALGHDLTQHEAKAATCTETGWNAYETCSRCDYTTYTEIPVLGHDPVQHEAKAATCTETGWDAYETCNRCNYTTYTEIPALGHDLTQHEAQAATCTEKGWNAYETCSRCDHTTYAEIPALGHDLKHHDAREATCIAAGWNEYDACTRCDYTTRQEIPALGHDPVHHEAQAATCTEKGWDAYDTCSRCDYTTYAEKPALGHDPVQHEAKAATCTEKGWSAYETCSRCDHTTYAEIPALGHDLAQHEAKAATCTDKGWNAYETCSRCGYTTYAEIPALGHNLTQHDAKEASCTEDGWDAYEDCSRCGYTTYVRKPAGHTIVHHEAKAATCTEKGWDAYDTCSRCNYTTYVEKPALGHDYVHHEAKAATCIDKGWDAYDTCSRCDYTTYAEIPKLGHDYVHHDAKAVTCTDKGWDAYDTCSRCDYTTYVEKPALGHDLKHHDAKAATCTEKGWDAYDTCSRCDYTTYAEISALGHDLKHHDAKDPTCTEPGWEAYDACTRCDHTTRTVIPALGHDYVHHDAKTPTCTDKGWDAYDTCSRCDYTTYVEKPASHTLEHHAGKEASCTEPGEEEWWKCTVCEKMFSDSKGKNEITAVIVIPAKHKLEKHEKAATCTEDGHETYWKCTACGKKFSDKDGTNEIQTVGTIPKLGHSWKTPTYTWSRDNSKVTAKRVCSHDSSHVQTETVATTYTVVKDATTKATGTGKYTSSAFKNTAFTVQTKTVTIPKYPTTYKDSNLTYKINSDLTAEVTGVAKSSLTSVTIPEKITVNGKKMKVVAIHSSAFKRNTKLTKITISKYIKKIGKNAFKECKNLKTITLKTEKLTSSTVGNDAFKGINGNATVKCPSKKLKDYRKFLPKKGVPKKGIR